MRQPLAPSEVPAERDEVFSDPNAQVTDFRFGTEVVAVFDDMVGRSVPFYAETQRMIGELAADFVTEGSNVYDLGCSTGTTMLAMHPTVHPTARFIGIDNSEEMLAKCRRKLSGPLAGRALDLRFGDLNQGVEIDNASLVTLILTLQFVRPLHRDRLIADIFKGLNANGCLVMVEKVLGEDSLFNRLFIKYYYDLKRRNGYSETEITQKRDALENVLIPYKLMENRELLLRSGFRYVDVFFKWYNFCGIVAVK
jgi:tRNA (cmo5U34)-methyltransferase